MTNLNLTQSNPQANTSSISSKLLRALNTGYMYLTSGSVNVVKSFIIKDSDRFYRLNNYGRVLKTSDLYDFLQELQQQRSFIQIDSFYHFKKINTLTLPEAVISLKSSIEQFKHTKNPIVIPICFSANHLLERDHITALLIDGQTIEYFDSLGIPSKSRKLKEGGTFHDILLYLKCLCKSNQPIIEYHQPIQKDINNCGRYVLYFYYTKLIMKNKIKQEVSLPAIADIVNKILLSRKIEDFSEKDISKNTVGKGSFEGFEIL